MNDKKIKQAILNAARLHEKGMAVPCFLNQMGMWGIQKHEAYRVLCDLIDGGFFEVDWKNKLIIVPNNAAADVASKEKVDS